MPAAPVDAILNVRCASEAEMFTCVTVAALPGDAKRDTIDASANDAGHAGALRLPRAPLAPRSTTRLGATAKGLRTASNANDGLAALPWPGHLPVSKSQQHVHWTVPFG